MPDTEVDFRLDPFPSEEELIPLWRNAWGAEWRGDLAFVLSRSIVHAGAYAGGRMVGFVNVAWDGGQHAFLLDTTVDPAFQRLGVGTELVRQVAAASRARGAAWLHVDYEPHLERFYAACGFRGTAAGLMRLAQP